MDVTRPLSYSEPNGFLSLQSNVNSRNVEEMWLAKNTEPMNGHNLGSSEGERINSGMTVILEQWIAPADRARM